MSNVSAVTRYACARSGVEPPVRLALQYEYVVTYSNVVERRLTSMKSSTDNENPAVCVRWDHSRTNTTWSGSR